jgi:hypothetical protein
VDLKRSNDPIWFTDVYRVDTEIILKSINWRYFYKQENRKYLKKKISLYLKLFEIKNNMYFDHSL